MLKILNRIANSKGPDLMALGLHCASLRIFLEHTQINLKMEHERQTQTPKQYITCISWTKLKIPLLEEFQSTVLGNFY